MRSPDSKSIFRQGFDYTLRKGLVRKLPLFCMAAVAMLILTLLDGAKTNYEIKKNSAGSSFEISNEFLETLNRETVAEQQTAGTIEASGKPESLSIDDTLSGWLNEPYRFKYQKFANGRALLDALAAKSMVVKEESKLVLEKERAVVEEQKQGLEKELAELKHCRRQKRAFIEKQVASINEQVAEKTNNINRINTDIENLEIPLKETTNHVYTTFGKRLPKVLLIVKGRKSGLLDDLLTPMLNEESSLNLVYQVFRLTALIIVILSFVFIAVMLIQQSPFSGDSETVSTQLRTLISMKPAGAAGEIAKTAIISVTALGVGTAVFVSAIAPETSAGSRPRANPLSPVTISGKFLNPNSGYLPDLNPVAEEYLLQTLFSLQIRNSNFYDWRRYGNSSQEPTIEFNPTILPAPVEVRTVPVPGGDYQALLVELNKLITKVNSASDLTEIRKQIDDLQAQLMRLNQPNCECQDTLTKIREQIEALNIIIGGNTTQPTPTPSPSASPSTDSSKNPASPLTPTSSPSPSPSPDMSSTKNPTPTPTPSSILGTLTKTASALDVIEKELIAMRADNLNKLGASSRNLATRTGELFGSEYYLVSEQAYLALQDLLKGNVKYDALVTALKDMKSQPPLKKSKFLSALRDRLTKTQIQEFKPWERVVLNYARLRR